MLDLNFPLLEQPLSLKEAIFLIIGDVTMFVKVAKWFYQYSESHELKLLNDRYKELEEPDLLIITDVLGFDTNSASTLRLIYVDSERQLNKEVEVKSAIDRLTATVSGLIGCELPDHEPDLEGDKITVLELFKVLDIKIETRSNTIFEKLLELSQVYKCLSKKKLLALINVCSYLTEEEISEV